MKKSDVRMNKSEYLGFSILDIIRLSCTISGMTKSETKHHNHDGYIDAVSFIMYVKTKHFSKTLNRM